MRLAQKLGLLSVAIGLSGGAGAESLHYNLVNLEVSVQREVPNDEMRAVLFAEHTDTDPARLAGRINRQMGEARKAAAAYPSIRVASGDNQTYPVYDARNRQSGWRSRAEVRLECQDFRLCAELIGRLQASLQLGGWEFALSHSARKQVEESLMTEAIVAFRRKADLVSEALHAPGYRLVNLAFSGQGVPPPRFAMAKGMMAVADAAPVAEGGSGNVALTLSGSVQLLAP